MQYETYVQWRNHWWVKLAIRPPLERLGWGILKERGMGKRGKGDERGKGEEREEEMKEKMEREKRREKGKEDKKKKEGEKRRNG